MSCAPRWSLWRAIWKNPAATVASLRAPTSRACAGNSRICCPGPEKIHRRPLTLIQCCWRFRAWRRLDSTPLGQLHSYTDDLSQHLSFLRVPQDAHRNRRQGMGLKNQFLAPQAAPAAGMPVPGFDEIDGTLIFRAPRSFNYLVAGFVDLNEAAGRQDGVHGKVLIANVAVGEISHSKLGKISER